MRLVPHICLVVCLCEWFGWRCILQQHHHVIITRCVCLVPALRHYDSLSVSCSVMSAWTRNGVLRTQKLRSPLLRIQTWQMSSLQSLEYVKYSQACFIHCHKCLPCLNFYLPGPFTFFFAPPYVRLTLVFLLFNCVLANAVFRAEPQNKIGHPAHSHKRFKQVPAASVDGIEIGTKERNGHWFSAYQSVLGCALIDGWLLFKVASVN